MTLLPTSADIHLKYVCTKCEAEYWLTPQEAGTKGFIIVCDYCGKKYFTEPIKTRVTFSKKKRSSYIKEKEATRILLKTGYSRDEIKKAITKASNNLNQCKDVQGVVKQLIQHM